MFRSCFAGLFVVSCCLVKWSTTEANQFKCTTGSSSIRCRDGVWPTTTQPPIPDPTKSLTINDLLLYTHQYQPIPHLPHLTSLTLDKIQTKAAGESLSRFPLQGFTASLDRAKLEVLSLTKVELSYISNTDFTGFTSLKDLSLAECNIARIDVDSFHPLATKLPGDNLHQSALKFFKLTSNDKLTDFPWSSLLPVAESLQSVYLNDNKLSVMTMTFPTGITSMSLTKLIRVWLSSTQLKTIPDAVLETFTQTEAKMDVRFMRNGNVCGSCDLVNLIRWAKARNRCQVTVDIHGSDGLYTTCQQKSPTTGFISHVTTNAIVIPGSCPALSPRATTPTPCPTAATVPTIKTPPSAQSKGMPTERPWSNTPESTTPGSDGISLTFTFANQFWTAIVLTAMCLSNL